MSEINITTDFIKLFLINCAIKRTKDEGKSKGVSLVKLLKKIKFNTLLDNKANYVLAYQYQHLEFDKNQEDKIKNVLQEIQTTKNVEEYLKKILLDNKLLSIFDILKPVINSAFKNSMSWLQEGQFIPASTEEILKEIKPILNKITLDQLTDSIDIKKILNQKHINHLLEKDSLLNDLLNVLKSKLGLLDTENQTYCKLLIDKTIKIKSDFYELQINIEKENNKIFENALVALTDNKIKVSQLSLLQTTFENIDKTYEISKNMERKFEFVNLDFKAFFSIELYMSLIKESRINKENDKIISDLKNKLQGYFIKYNNKKLLSTLLYRCIQKDYIDEMFLFVDYYNLNKESSEDINEIFMQPNLFQNKIKLVEQLHQKFEINEKEIIEIDKIISQLSDNEQIKKQNNIKTIKTDINNKIKYNLSQYLNNNDLLDLYENTGGI